MDPGRNFHANSDYSRRTCSSHRHRDFRRAASHRAARPAAHRRRRLSENSRAVSREASAHHLLGDVVRTLPRRIPDAQPVDLGISAERIESRRHQSRRRWRLDPDATLSSRATSRRSRVTASERAASMLSQRPSCPVGTARFRPHFFTRPTDTRSATCSAEPIAKRSKRPFASSWHPTPVPLLENEVASSPFSVTTLSEPPNSDTNASWQFKTLSCPNFH